MRRMNLVFMMKMVIIILSIRTILIPFRIILLRMNSEERSRNRCPVIVHLLLIMQIEVQSLNPNRRFVCACIPWRRDGTLPSRGVFPRHAPDAHARSAYTVRPLNGRPVKPEIRLTFSKSVRARVFACARVALRVCDVFIRCLTRRPPYLKYYFKSKDPFKRIRVRLHAWGISFHTGECFGRLHSMHSRCLYGFMRCEIIPCISSIVCSRYMSIDYSNCPVSWCKPVGLAGVRTLNPCLMVRKDTNSKSK